MPSFTPPYNVSNPPSRQPSPLPKRTDSLSSNIAKPKFTSPILKSREDLKLARVILGTPITAEDGEEADDETREQRQEDRERELIDTLGRMANWVEELGTLLQQAYKNQTDLETALTLTRSNLQLALANNEMLEEALKRGGGQDIGWRRWSEREGVRRTSSVRDYSREDRPNSVAEVPPAQPQTAASRFFNFKSPLQLVSSSSNTSPTSTQTSPSSFPESDGHAHTASAPSLLPSAHHSNIPTSSQNGSVPYAQEFVRSASPQRPSEREEALAAQLAKERAALQALGKEKTQLEDELESLSQALFEEANKMVSKANRKLAETEEELRIATEQKEALKGALRIVEGENGALRGRSPAPPMELDQEPEPEVPHDDTPRITVSTATTPPSSATLTTPQGSYWSPVSPGVDNVSSPSSPSSAAALPTPKLSASGHRWSVMPRTPRSRSAVRNEFEQAMRRMHDLVDEDAGAGEGSGSEGGDGGSAQGSGRHRKPEQDSRPEKKPRADHSPEPMSPHLEFATRASSESEVEEELQTGSGELNPWKS